MLARGTCHGMRDKRGVNVNISRGARATQECPESLIQHHQDNMQSVGYVSAAYFALVHKAVPRNKVKFIKGTQEAVDKEYNKLNDRQFVDWSSVREKRHVRDDAQANNESVHFGALMTLCHEKLAEWKSQTFKLID